MQHGRWVEAGKRVEARLQKADSGREGMACVSNRMGSEQAHGGVVGSRLRADARRGAEEMDHVADWASTAGDGPRVRWRAWSKLEQVQHMQQAAKGGRKAVF